MQQQQPRAARNRRRPHRARRICTRIAIEIYTRLLDMPQTRLDVTLGTTRAGAVAHTSVIGVLLQLNPAPALHWVPIQAYPDRWSVIGKE